MYPSRPSAKGGLLSSTAHDCMLHRALLLKLALVAAVPILLVGATVRADIDRSWAEMDQQIGALTRQRETLSTSRDAVYGETVDELAWPHYEDALQQLDNAFRTRPMNFDAAMATTEEERASRDVLLQELEPAFVALRRGAHARDAATGLDWSVGEASLSPVLLRAHMLAIHSVAKARAQVERGDDMGAIETLLDAQQFACDLASSSCVIEEMLGLASLTPMELTHWLEDGGAGEFSSEALGRWLDGMDRLRSTLPSDHRALLGHVELLGRRLQRTITPEPPVIPGVTVRWRGPEIGPGLRHRFSWRHAAAEFVARTPELTQRVERASGLTLSALEELEAELALDPNPLMRMMAAHVTSTARSRRYCLGRLDFLRHAIALRLNRATTELNAPFGHPVHVEETAHSVRVWTRAEGTGPLDITLAFKAR